VATGMTVTGNVTAPADIPLARVESGRSASANGSVAKVNVDVRVYQVDDEGNQIGGILATVKTDANGVYSVTLPQGVTASPNLILEVGSGDNKMRSFVLKDKVDINPISELLVDEIVTRGEPLAKYKVADIENILSTVTADAVDIDFNGEASIRAVLRKMKNNSKLADDLNNGIMNASGTKCGNNTIDGNEVCDRDYLNDQTCALQGFDSGILSCKNNCTFDTSACTNLCGDNHASASQVCDGSDLKGETCVSKGFDGGTLGCNITCDAFDTSGCIRIATCGNGTCESNLEENSTSCPADCGCPSGKVLHNGVCVTPACTSNSNCNDDNAGTTDSCTNAGLWNAACVNTAITSCTNSDSFCPAGCNSTNDSDCSASDNNGICEAGENCGNSADCACSSGICCSNTCTTASCSSNGACDDSNAGTIDTCSNAGTCSSACVHTAITSCTNGDGYCPSGCSLFNDNNCPATCGNGHTEGSEACDNGDNNGTACTPVYGSSCTYCSSNCNSVTLTGHYCGDGNLDLANGEECEGTNLNSATCISQGYTGGTLTCNTSCRLDTSACTSTPAYVSQQYAGQCPLSDGIFGAATPRGVFVGGGRKYIADSNNRVVVVMEENTCNVITTLSVTGYTPGGGCISPDGSKIIITLGSSSKFALITFDSGTYTNVNVYGSNGTGLGQFDTVGQCDFDSSGSIVSLADSTSNPNNHTNHRVQKWNSTTKQFVSILGAYGSTAGLFINPKGLIQDSSNNLFVLDGTGRLQKFNSSGTVDPNFSLTLTATSYIGIDSNDRIYAIGDDGKIRVYSNIDGSLVGTVNNGGPTSGNISVGVSAAIGSGNWVFAIDGDTNVVMYYH